MASSMITGVYMGSGPSFLCKLHILLLASKVFLCDILILVARAVVVSILLLCTLMMSGICTGTGTVWTHNDTLHIPTTGLDETLLHRGKG